MRTCVSIIRALDNSDAGCRRRLFVFLSLSLPSPPGWESTGRPRVTGAQNTVAFQCIFGEARSKVPVHPLGGWKKRSDKWCLGCRFIQERGRGGMTIDLADEALIPPLSRDAASERHWDERCFALS
ncbi:hypothetical protein TNCV_3848251 [Trichonephila clavipes]|uniref:Uncharacterized protein n=1 Tax=Trichonephila clavipes TaxID=2585209 RepID=A0A8X6RA02_TRICX|nr:hypothetical protein TNCV_3848251 [Trichonephila clavipes]